MSVQSSLNNAKEKVMVDYCFLSLRGSYEVNEDSVGFVNNPQRQCFILADGLGGHGKGDVASAAAVQYAQQFLSTCTVLDRNAIEQCFNGVHAMLEQIRSKEHSARGIKTTMVLLIIENSVAYWAHVGDSRLYRFNRFKVVEQTKDHSVPQMMVMMGEITEKQIRGNPDRNKLLRALGMDGDPPRVEVHFPGTPVKKGDSFLLCSDGFWELIDESQMQKSLIFSRTAADWLDKMKTTVETNGRNVKMDNYSAITVKIV